MNSIVLLMGVSGSGKTTVGTALAGQLGWQMQEGDALHPPENVAKMARGEALTDADRAPWLAAIGAVLDRWHAAGQSGIVTCSALKRAYRDRLREGRPELVLVFLRGAPELIHDRLEHRQGHFMPVSLLGSQFATLEEPAPEEGAIVEEIDRPADDVARDLAARLVPATRV